MPVTANKLTIVHSGSGGVVQFFPDVCKTPSSGGPIPIPYPNVAQSSDAAKTAASVKCQGNPVAVLGSQFASSTGDEAGSVGGVVSGVTKGAAEFMNGAFDVLAEGKPIARQTDIMLGNKGGAFNTPPAPEMQAPMPPANPAAADNPEQKKATLKVLVKDSAGNPVKDARYVLDRPDGSRVEGKTDASGEIEIAETVPGVGRLVFPDLPSGTVFFTD